MVYFSVYLVVMNCLGFLSMYIDKKKAIKKAYRIPEATLFMIAILGGSIGSIVGMEVCRHKTKHWYFKVGMPIILIIQVILLGFIGYELLR